MKYKITAIVTTVFIFISLIGFLVVGGRLIQQECNLDGFSFSSLKNLFIFFKDENAKMVFCHDEYVDVNGAYHQITGKKYVKGYDSVAKLKNNMLIYADIEKENFDGAFRVESLKEFDAALQEKNIDFLYVLAPAKLSRYDYNEYLPYKVISPGANSASLVDALEKSDLSYIDIESQMRTDGISHYGSFFKSDHHWLPQTGFYANTLICEYLKDNSGFEFNADILNIDRYNQDTYTKSFLGTQGRGTGTVFSPVDDMTLIYPRFDTDILVNTGGDITEGTFFDAIFRMEYLTQKADTNDNDYFVYLGGSVPWQLIKNNNADNDKKIVLVADSFSGVCAPYLSLACSELHLLDGRWFKGESIYDYAVRIEADIVISLHNASAITDDRFFNFMQMRPVVQE